MSNPIPTFSEYVPKPRLGPIRRLVGLIGPLLVLVMILDSRFVASHMPSSERTLYFKLPLEGVRFHWRFLDPEAFLAGELTLRIINKNRDQTLVVFRDGKIHDGWKMLGDPRTDGGFYFGFSTDDRVLTSAKDSLIITLKVVKDLPGKGQDGAGILAAGTWRSSGSYSSIYGGKWSPIDYLVRRGNPPIAFMECWDNPWPFKSTSVARRDRPLPAGGHEVGILEKMNRSRGTNGRLCGSHI